MTTGTMSSAAQPASPGRKDQAAPLPAAPPTIAREPRDVDMLLAFLRERDVPCPRCGYNLRDLTQPACPECREELTLIVARREIGFGWLLLSLVPGAFSGIAAAFLLMVIVTILLSPRGKLPPWPVPVLDVFGWCSGLFAIGLYLKRDRFLRKTKDRQRAYAAVLWAVHVGMFILFVSVMWML